MVIASFSSFQVASALVPEPRLVTAGKSSDWDSMLSCGSMVITQGNFGIQDGIMTLGHHFLSMLTHRSLLPFAWEPPLQTVNTSLYHVCENLNALPSSFCWLDIIEDGLFLNTSKH